jgi:gluconolactonase
VHYDNIRLDDEGRLWAAALEDGVHCYAPDGTLIGRLRVPGTVANVTFGGPKNNRLFITAATTVYSLVMSVTGAPRV